MSRIKSFLLRVMFGIVWPVPTDHQIIDSHMTVGVDGFYSARCKCVNCGYEAVVRFPKGHSAHRMLEKCPNCELKMFGHLG